VRHTILHSEIIQVIFSKIRRRLKRGFKPAIGVAAMQSLTQEGVQLHPDAGERAVAAAV
jgi:hypothetical protein